MSLGYAGCAAEIWGHLSLSPSAVPADSLYSTARNPDCLTLVPRAPVQLCTGVRVTQTYDESHASTAHKPHRSHRLPWFKKIIPVKLLTTFKHLHGVRFLQEMILKSTSG